MIILLIFSSLIKEKHQSRKVVRVKHLSGFGALKHILCSVNRRMLLDEREETNGKMENLAL